MFKLESYITPLLMGYIDKYVKLKHEDFQLSLWGGDAVLNKLDLRLDAIEKAIHLPITFKSGFIHELRLHVPWTKLGSEPVVVTINTIECILKLRDGSDEMESNKSTGSSKPSPPSASSRPRTKKPEPDEELPPGYLQSLVNRIMNNVNIVVNNLILKFVEDDIVLSVNVKSVESFSVDGDWDRSFIELSLPELVLRRVINFHDLTVCLDKRNASGKIDTYQDPLLYRCSITCRLHLQYNSIKSKMPCVTKLNVLCEKLDLSLTDTQVPMFFRLLELWLAIYYGSLELPEARTKKQGSETSATESQIETITHDDLSESAYAMDGVDGGEGWGSWAWSYVPSVTAILPTYEEEDEEDRRYSGPSVMAVGFYCSASAIRFKLTETIRASPYYGPAKTTFKPCMLWEAKGLGMEVVLCGLQYFNVQCGVTSTRMYCEGEAISGGMDMDNTGRDPCFLKAGDPLATPANKSPHFLTASLFDPGGVENQGNGERAVYILDQQRHQAEVTESAAEKRFGAGWMDYMYVMEEAATTARGEDMSGSRSSAVSESGVPENARENSVLRLVGFASTTIVSSSMVQRLHKFVHCMRDHEYEPYSKIRPEEVDELRQPPTEEQIQKLEEFIPIRTYKYTLVRPTLIILANDLPKYDVKAKRIISHRKAKKASKQKDDAPPHKADDNTASLHPALPALVLQTGRIDMQTTCPMYALKLVQNVSKMAAPSDTLLSHCHSHLHVEISNAQAGLKKVEPNAHFHQLPPSPIRNIMHPWSGTYDCKTLLLPMYWKNCLQPRSYGTYYLSELQFNFTKAQLLLLVHGGLTWMDRAPANAKLHDITLLDDVFGRGKAVSSRPVLQFIVSNLEVVACETEAIHAVTGSLTTIYVLINSAATSSRKQRKAKQDSITPLLCGPQDTTNLYNRNYFDAQAVAKDDSLQKDCVTFTVQLPKQPQTPQAPAVIFVDVQGVVGCIDPVLYDWLMYAPQHIAKDTPPALPAAAAAPETPHLPRVDSVLTGAADTSLVEGGITSPVQASRDSQGGSSMTLPTDTTSQTHGKTKTAKTTEEPTLKQKPKTSLGDKLVLYYPLVKILQVQVEVCSCCIFAPVRHVELEKDQATMSIPANLHAAHTQGSLPPTLVMCCPSLKVHSQGHRHANPAQEIPIRSLEASIAGEKLPWCVELGNASMYTLHDDKTPSDIVHPVTVATSVSVATKYAPPPTSDALTSLGLVLHADMNTIEVVLCNKQMQLAYDLLNKALNVMSEMRSGLELFNNLHPSLMKSLVAMGASPQQQAPPTRQQQAPPIRQQAPPTAPSSSSPDEAANAAVAVETATDTTTTDVMTGKEGEDAGVSAGDGGGGGGGAEGVKLSLWLQWTLLKFGLCLNSSDLSGNDVSVCMELEDLTSSLDMQEVYSKAICKVGTVAATHAIKKKGSSTWEAGSFDGLVFSCTEQVTRSTRVMGSKPWAPTSSQSPPPYIHPDDDPLTPPAPPPPPRDKNHGFLQLTLTRALRKNVRRRMKAMEGGGAGGAGEGKAWTRGNVYLNEICLTIQPCDIVLNCPVFVNFMHMFNLEHQVKKERKVKPLESPKDEQQSFTMSYLATCNLPLVYINASNLRVFIPKCVNVESDKDDGSEYVLIDGSSEAASKMDAVGTDSDVCVLQMASLALQPHADNPLPRIVLERDVYRRAVHAGITSHVGSEVEDRQYQLDVSGLSLSTGDWHELVSRSRKSSRSQDTDIQNPAVEWNNMDQQKQSEDVAVGLLPLASGCDFRVVVAPPVLYYTENKQPLLVCGQSLEINATSDMDFYCSVGQISLLQKIMQTNINPILQVLSAPEKNMLKDSPKPIIKAETKPKTAKSAELTPFDVLLTAGKISFMLYKHTSVLNGKDESGDLEKLGQGHDIDKLGQGVDIEKLGQGEKDRKGISSRIVPILYGYFSQPHSLARCLEGSQSIELSCYDIVFKGAKAGHFVQDDSKSVPDPSDFSIHFLETRPGLPDPKTGIPPSLYTLRVSDFLHNPASLLLKIERPLCVNISTEKLDQLRGLLEEFSSSTNNRGNEPDLGETERKEVETEKEDLEMKSTEVPQILQILTKVDSVQIQTVQLVAAMETKNGPNSAAVQMSVSGISNQLSFRPDKNQVQIEELSSTTVLSDVFVKTCWGKTWRPLLGPVTASINLTGQWSGHGGTPLRPRLLLLVETSLLPCYVGQEHVMCGEMMAREVLRYVQGNTNSETPVKRPSQPSPPSQSKSSPRQPQHSPSLPSEQATMDESHDDLRAGEFIYITEEGDSERVLPGAREVYFREDFATGRATLTWTYSEPRAITALHSTPVPLTLPQALDVRYINENMKIPCILQGWNTLRQEFDNYVEFGLSEHVTSVAKIPTQEQEVMIAQSWRVLILHPRDKGDLCDLIYELDGDDIEPVVSPYTLAASLRVDSCFLPHLVPSIQCSVSMTTLQLRLANHITTTPPSTTDNTKGTLLPGAEEEVRTPDCLAPFCVESSGPAEQECLTLIFDDPKVRVTAVQGRKQGKVDMQGSCSVQCDILEYRTLTMRPLLEPVKLHGDVMFLGSSSVSSMSRGGGHSPAPTVKGNLDMGSLHVRVGQAALHTLNCTTEAWTQLLKNMPTASPSTTLATNPPTRPVYHYYVLCNNTCESLRVGQLATEEVVPIKPREAVPYAWRTPTSKQRLRVCVESLGWQWSDSIDIDHTGTSDYVIDKGDQRATVIVTVKQINNVQKQVIISGQFVISSRLSEGLEVRLLTTRAHKEPITPLPAMSTMPSYVLEHSHVRALKLRLAKQRTLWSQEIVVEKGAAPKLIKLQTVEDQTRHLHVWCHVFEQSFGQSSQHLVLLTPVFVLSTMLPSPLLLNVSSPHSPGNQQQVMVDGRGHQRQLHNMAGDTTHTVTFQLRPDMAPSNPPITISSGLMDQLPKVSLDQPNIDQLTLGWKPDDPGWPYDEDDKLTSSSIRKPSDLQTTFGSTGELDLQVCLSQCWPGCNTLLISVAPSMLIVNNTHLDLILVTNATDNGDEVHGKDGKAQEKEGGNDGKREWALPGMQTVAPHTVQGSFHLGVSVHGKLHCCPSPLELSSEDHMSRYLPAVEGLLYLKADVPVTIPIHSSNGSISKFCYLSLHSTVKDNVRILTVKERFALANLTKCDLNLDCHTVPLCNSKVVLDHSCHQSVPRGTESYPLIVWNVTTAIPQEVSSPINMHQVHYVAFKINQSQAATSSTSQSQSEALMQALSQSDVPIQTTFNSPDLMLLQNQSQASLQVKPDPSYNSEFDWSCPLRVKSLDKGGRQNVAVPLWKNGCYNTTPLTVATQIHNGVTYITVEEESEPAFVLQNNCNFGLHMGQTLCEDIAQDTAIYEEAELTSHLPILPPRASSHYAFPSHNATFPEISSSNKLRLHFAGCASVAKSYVLEKVRRREKSGDCGCEGCCHTGALSWSHGIDVTSAYDVFVTVPGMSDIKAHMEKVGHTVFVYIDPMNRAEISAKEIRSRISGKDVVEEKSEEKERSIMEESVRLEIENAMNDDPSVDISVLLEGTDEDSECSKNLVTQFEVSVHCKQATLVLLDEISQLQNVLEMIRLTADEITMSYAPKATPILSVLRPRSYQEVVLKLQDLQIDNQLYSGETRYDYPVVMLKQSGKDIADLLTLTLGLCTDFKDGVSKVTSVRIHVEPLSMFIEDTFIYNIVQRLETFLPSTLSCDQKRRNGLKQKFPSVIRIGSYVLNCPIRLEEVIIEPVRMLLSVHASVKLFLASDNTPLSFGQFERSEVFSSGQQLTKAVVLHYASGALFRAGLVVGSLELLGNPTGLVRSVGAGVADLFRLPYEGLSRGPGAFLHGMTQGMGSLIKHVSTGTLTSITNFASSVSRNMDALSLDEEHRARQEEGRRRDRPDGLTQGLYNGLTGFGLSLLGAVAGLADHPLQTLTVPASASATGLVSGVGRGLVGVVTKPLGGAAELVSQTGMGLLQGAGLGQFPAPRERATHTAVKEYGNSALKYAEKLVLSPSSPPSACCPPLLLCTAGQQLVDGRPPLAVSLLLLPHAVLVVGTHGDEQLQALAVAEVECRPSRSDAGRLYVVLDEPPGTYNAWQEDRMSNNDRVKAFVDNTTSDAIGPYGGQSDPKNSPPIGILQYEFRVDVKVRDLFVSSFNMAKNKALGSGFPL